MYLKIKLGLFHSWWLDIYICPLNICCNVTIGVELIMIRLALRRLLLLAAWSAVLLLLTRPLIRNTDNVTIHNKHEDAQVMDKLDQGRLDKSTFQSQLICARYCFI